MAEGRVSVWVSCVNRRVLQGRPSGGFKTRFRAGGGGLIGVAGLLSIPVLPPSTVGSQSGADYFCP
jgi:hypothetical protein